MFSNSNFKLGILGGGQLGRMLLAETQKWDIHTSVLDPSNNAPCKQFCNTFVQGDLMDYNTVYNFGKKVTVLTIEIEHINIEALYTLEKEGVQVYPQPAVIETIQDKGKQKSFFIDNQISTAPFKLFPSKRALLESKKTFPYVWKSTKFGYDGTGVKVVRSENDLLSLPDMPCIAENLIPFKNELAVIVARDVQGNIKSYPVVEMEFHPDANQVEYVLCPARISDAIAQKSQDVALKIAEKFKHIGILAVELFQTETDEILVNEVAPRPHNSGHYSIEASYTSQFEQHLRILLQLPLGSTHSKLSGVMVNLVGAEGFEGNVVYKNITEVLELPGVTPHIYGKQQTRAFRKMGHVTVVDPDINIARATAEKVKNTIKVIT